MVSAPMAVAAPATAAAVAAAAALGAVPIPLSTLVNPENFPFRGLVRLLPRCLLFPFPFRQRLFRFFHFVRCFLNLLLCFYRRRFLCLSWVSSFLLSSLFSPVAFLHFLSASWVSFTFFACWSYVFCSTSCFAFSASALLALSLYSAVTSFISELSTFKGAVNFLAGCLILLPRRQSLSLVLTFCVLSAIN